MAEIIVMPKLGYTQDEGTIAEWHKKVGDTVENGEPFFDVQTDKSVITVEASCSGTVLKIVLEPDETVPVLTPVAVVGQPGEDPDAALAGYTVTTAADQHEDSLFDDDEAEAAPAAEPPAASLKLTPRAQKYVQENQIDPASLAGIQGTGFEGGITERDIKASPLAKKIAEKKGVDLSSVQGSGQGGKIMKQDVEKAASAAPAAAAPAGTENLKVLKTEPYKGVRKIIGDRLSESKFTSPHLYFTNSVDTTNMTSFRKELTEAAGRKISVSDLIVYACAKALQKYPEMNTSLIDGNIVTYKSVNVGVAVAGDRGLVVPVIKNCQEKSLTQVSEENRALVDKAKEGKLTPDEYADVTFSISNLGMFGIENFTAIINPPCAAILSISSVIKKPVVIEEDGEDKIVIRPMMNIQLSVDHRLIDGLLAAQFVGYVKTLLENPLQILV